MKNKTTQGLGNKKLLSFPKHDSLKYWRQKCNVNSTSYVNAICESIRIIILIIFRFVAWETNGVSKETTCAENLDCGKCNKPLPDSCHRSGKGILW
jgi:hypothetical protein